jgi:putative ABC transport system permease protein
MRAARRWYRAQVARSVAPAVARRLRATAGSPDMSTEVYMSADSRDRRSLIAEARWAWRGLRVRGWRAVFIVMLFGVALAANAIVFAAADAFVFHTLPYRQPDRLVIVEKTGRVVSDYIWPAALKGWREHRDLFAAMHAHVRGASAYLTLEGITDAVRAELVTPGFFEMIGVVPRWGRPFVDADASAGAPKVGIIGEGLARRLFGTGEAAIGRDLFTGSETFQIVGVMPAAFRFPGAREEIWRPLDLSTWPDNSGVRNVARLAEGATLESATQAFAGRAPAVELLLENRLRTDQMRLRPMAAVRGNAGARTVFSVLAAAAACLLLIACGNVASLEVAAASRRLRDHAIQAALGASRASLIRVTLGEGVVLLACGAIVAVVLSTWGMSVLDAQLTVAMRDALTNPLDVDLRAMAFMLAIAAAAWLLTSIPAIRRLSRLSIADGLRDDPRTMPVSRGAARSRQVLMAGQVALTTLLLAGALLYIRTYAAKVGLEKGFDDSNIATINVGPAPDAALKGAALETRILARLRATAGIRAVSRTDSLPPDTQSGISARLTIDDREPTAERIMLHSAVVDPEYFGVMDLSIVQGRAFQSGSPRDEVVVDERFARTYWPGESPIGARFKMQSAGVGGVRDFHIIGVSRQLRADRLTDAAGDQVFVFYIQPSPTYSPLTFVARLDEPARLADLDDIVRAEAGRSIVRIDTVAARYARLDAGTRLVAAVTSGFGAIALLVAVTGVYAVMAYLVAGRSREIAIRMALGADRAGVRRLVLGSALGFVAIGAAAGIGAAIAVARGLRAELFGVTPTDPATYGAVAALIVATAVAASWWPAHRASRVDPAIALRDG